ELLEADGEDALGLGHEAAIAVDIAGREARDLRLHARRVAAVIEDAPVVKADAIEGVDGDEGDVVLEAAAGEREQLLEQEGGGDDGGAAVEGEAGIVIDVGAAAGLIALVDERDGEAARLQADGSGEPAEAGTDDDYLGTIGHGGQFYARGP